MKPDMKLFPYLKEDSQFTSWYKQLIGVMMGEIELLNHWLQGLCVTITLPKK